MSKVLGLLGATLLFTGPAFAADLPLKAPLMVPPLFSWTGFYLGGEVGAKWADTTWTTTSLTDTSFPRPIDGTSPRDFSPVGARVGGYFGYNLQFAPQWVAGVEADIAWADKTASAAGLPGCAQPVANTCGLTSAPGPGVDLSSVKMGWDASVRARLGFLLTPDLLLYGTGGVAWQQLETSGTCQHSAPDPYCLVEPGNPFVTVTNSTVRTGWTVGGGLEAHVFGNWLLRGEYRYSDFGTWNNVFNFNVAGEPPGFDTYRFHLKATTQIATVGLAYKF